MKIIGIDPAPEKEATPYDRASGWPGVDYGWFLGGLPGGKENRSRNVVRQPEANGRQ